MKIKVSYDPPPIPVRDYDWHAFDQDTYDGALDSSNRNDIGWGRTKEEALADLQRILRERAEEA